MLTHKQFLQTVLTSFKCFIDSGTSRSTSKLKPLHGAIAADLAKAFGSGYRVAAQGYGEGKEAVIQGRYIDKAVDITVQRAADGKAVAGIGVKFVMQNYWQNSNNYFENMLGETANIRAALVPYFQVFVILDRLPYYKNSGELAKWETMTPHNMQKYCMLTNDNADRFPHTPNKTLVCVAHITPEAQCTTKKEYLDFYRTHKDRLRISDSPNKYPGLAPAGTVILNDYRTFMDKVFHTIKAL